MAALGLGGVALGCDRGGREPRTASVESGARGTGGQASTPGRAPGSTVAGQPTPGQSTPGSDRAVSGEPQCLITKEHGLPSGYVPQDLTALPGRLLASDGVRLRRVAADAVVRLVDAAAREGHTLFVLSGFRSYQEQEAVMREEIRLYGERVARQQVAPPGHSEHQLGLAADITSSKAPYDLRQAFGQEPEGRWLAASAVKFGFVVSYPQGKEDKTGYTYEPWHIRYIGPHLAQEVAASGLTLTEFLPRHNLAGGCP